LKVGKEQAPAKMAADFKDLDQGVMQLESLGVSPEKMNKIKL
jgi:hypothetical protein